MPARINQVHNASSGNQGQAWSGDSALKTRSLGQRESHPMYNQISKAVSPTGTMNGHCSQGAVALGTQVPGPVDNVPLVEPDTRKVSFDIFYLVL